MHIFSRLTNWTIRSKIIIIFSVLLSLFAGQTALSLEQARETNATVQELTGRYVALLIQLDKLRGDLSQFRGVLTLLFSHVDDKAAVERNDAARVQALGVFRQDEARFSGLVSGEVETKFAESTKAVGKDYFARIDIVMGMLAQGRAEEAKTAFFGDAIKYGPHLDKALEEAAQFFAAGASRLGTEASASFSAGRWYVIEFVCTALVVAVLSGIFLVMSIARPIASMTAAMGRLAANDLAVALPATDRSDEVGLMARAVGVFRQNMVRVSEFAAEQERLEAEAVAARKLVLNQTADEFQSKIGLLVADLSSGSAELRATAQSMSSAAAQANEKAAMMATSAQSATAGVETVAAAAEALTASIGEITREVARSAQITGQAVSDAERTDVIVQALAEGAGKIGQIVQLIGSIAGQTNLLALNATIEASRAGDAGKGFAVVASEVKNLAVQTASATREIGAQVEQIQGATRDAVGAIKAISAMISEASVIGRSIVAAVETQGSATAAIAANVNQTAQNTQAISSTIVGVSQAANDTGDAATHVLGAATALSLRSEQLTAEINNFVSGIRAR
jgi:methyl-accepting chemotaxis protein